MKILVGVHHDAPMGKNRNYGYGTIGMDGKGPLLPPLTSPFLPPC